MVTFKKRTAEVVLQQGDDETNANAARMRLEVARLNAAGPAPIGGDTEVVEAREAYQRALQTASDNAIVLTLESLGVVSWRALRAEHPPRKVRSDDNEIVEHPDDEPYGVNSETMAWPLLEQSIISPEMAPSALRAFLESLPEAHFVQLFNSAYILNTGQSADPKSTMQFEGILTSLEI